MSRIKRLAGAAAVALLGSAGLVAATAGPAAAAPNLCTLASNNIDYAHGTSWTKCTMGSGWYRVGISCKPAPDSRFTYYYYGSWVSVQETNEEGWFSSASCKPGEAGYIISAWTQIK